MRGPLDGEAEAVVQLRVCHAFSIPKVDMMSESDPYVVLQLPGWREQPRTATINVRHAWSFPSFQTSLSFLHRMNLLALACLLPG
jgi:hypothetical protein